MHFLMDTHIHTVASGHAYSTWSENAKMASEKGLTAIAITDHAPAMEHTTCHAYFANLHVIPNELYGVKIYKGIELNILDFDGHVDMDDRILQKLDIAIASLHTPCLTPGTKEQNTNAVLRMMEHPLIDIFGHPGDPRYPLDYDAVIQKSKETGTLLEINNTSLIPGGFRSGSKENIAYLLQQCKQQEIPVVLGSDAHFCTDIGKFDHALALLQEIGMPETLVLNTNPERLLSALKRNR